MDLLYCVLHGGTPVRGYQYYYNTLNNQSCGVDYSSIMGVNNPNNYHNNLTEMVTFNLLKILRSEPYYSMKYFDNETYPIVTVGVDVTHNNPHEGGGISLYHYVHAVCSKTISNPYIIESSAKIGKFDGSNYNQTVWHVDPPCNANVEYVAKKIIHLKPGFRVEKGAKFRARIDNSGCQVKPPTDMAVFSFPPGIYDNGGQSMLLSNTNNQQQRLLEEMSSKTTENNDLNNYKDKLSISPNPTTGIVNITVGNMDEYHHLSLKNSLGKELYSTDFVGNLNINLSSYPKGIYFIIITTDTGSTKPDINKVILI